MSLVIDTKIINTNSPAYIIAEISANHLGKLDTAIEMIRIAKEIGADAVKIQTYTADTITINCSNNYFKINQGTIWDGKILYDLYKEAYTPWEWQPKLKDYADEIGITLFSSPFDKTAVDFLETIDVPAYKIASFEITDIPLIGYVASKGKPVIISTGIATLEEIHEAVDACKRSDNNQIALLKCTSSYPAPFEEINLRTIPDMIYRFNAVIGLSDHTLGSNVSLAAVALGAKIIEKHFIIDRSLGGPDAAFSMEPDEFKDMVKNIRDTEKALGKVSYELTEKTKANRNFSRSLFAVEDIRQGESFTERNIRSIRPGYGIKPKHLDEILTRKASQDIQIGTPLSWELVN